MTDKTDDQYQYQYPDPDPGPAQTARLRARLASRVAEAPGDELLAAALRRLQEAEGIGPETMAARLGTDTAGMDRLALCRLPRADRFAEDTARIADYCGCTMEALLPLLRQVDVLATFAEPGPEPGRVQATAPHAETAPEGKRQTGWWGGGALVAARDTDENGENEEDEADAGDE